MQNLSARTTIAIVFVSTFCFILVSSQQSPNSRNRQGQSSGLTKPKLQSTTTPQPSLSRSQNEPPKQSSSTPNATPNASNNTPLRTQERSVVSSNNNTNGRLEIVEDELPADFYEMPPEQLDIGMNATGRAPVPILNVAVLQNGQMIDSAINVHPGTPLEMVIYLDDKSAKVYGLLASFLKVQDDTFRQREETIILNGCSIDTYIFGNFEPHPEDQSLRAKFRAFKFPDSNFVRFVGTVNVCIKQCAKVNCTGGRKKRAIHQSGGAKMNTKDDRLVSLTVSTVLRISNPTSTPES